jgi:acyl-homoserine lactone acylase PvdQ
MANIYRLSIVTALLCGSMMAAVAPYAASADEQPALARQVQIRRTQYGVPHITGESLAAAAFGFGYCQAEDHLLNIMRGIIGVRGTLAETFGPGEDGKNIESDFFNRQFRVYARAVKSYHTLSPDYRDMLAGYAAGLNYYTARHRDQLPAWIPQVN